jgi:hypothetical protein
MPDLIPLGFNYGPRRNSLFHLARMLALLHITLAPRVNLLTWRGTLTRSVNLKLEFPAKTLVASAMLE